jgi:Bacterial SH3 domain.
MNCLDTALKLPEWYIFERKTETTVEKLTTMKELDYYLSNPNEFIRRQAIIRLSSLKLKESGNRLLEVIEDPLESNDNKNLAAWALKVTYSKSSTDILINNRYLSRYTGNESLNDIYPITYEDITPDIRFEFSSNPDCIQLNTIQDELTGLRNFKFESSFNMNLWLKALFSYLAVKIKNCILWFAKNLISIPKAIYINYLVKVPDFIKYVNSQMLAKRMQSKERPASKHAKLHRTANTYGQYNGAHTVYYRGKQREVSDMNELDILITKARSGKVKGIHSNPITTTATFMKKVVFNMLYILFTPIRIFLKHKFAALLILAGFYIFLNYTSPGRILFKNYFGKDFQVVQDNTANTLKQKTAKVWEDFKAMTSLDKLLNNDRSDESTKVKPVIESVIKYTVTAPKGLNLRKQPNLTSEKVAGGPLEFGSTISYLDKQTKDSTGILWYYIKTSDGRSGWASKKYLKRMDG